MTGHDRRAIDQDAAEHDDHAVVRPGVIRGLNREVGVHALVIALHGGNYRRIGFRFG